MGCHDEPDSGSVSPRQESINSYFNIEVKKREKMYCMSDNSTPNLRGFDNISDQFEVSRQPRSHVSRNSLSAYDVENKTAEFKIPRYSQIESQITEYTNQAPLKK